GSDTPGTNLNTGDAPTGPTTPRKGPPKFKQRQTRQFKRHFGKKRNHANITVICPWEAFSHLELHELAQFGII
uniref:Retinal cone rhodopsin-sensitive cGMP 3',5'-cyclic phosphodiesterase subunit gamma n=1 Tax=Strix occidentalis caurina TaxID=311401 RepID=A0A8D0EVD9_STROC